MYDEYEVLLFNPFLLANASWNLLEDLFMKKSRGFTLIELMIVVAILSIVASVLAGGVAGEVGPYGWMNSKEVIGMVDRVVSVSEDSGVVVSGDNTIRSTSVTLKALDGTYIEFSSTDRKWFGLKDASGKRCVKARIFPYIPIGPKGGSYYAGQLLRQADTCEQLR